MEFIACCITVLAILSTLVVNTPMETPFQAIFASCAAGLLAVVGGASLLSHIVIAVQERFVQSQKDEEEEEDYSELSLGSWRRVSGHGPAEFDTFDRFYHVFGICCCEKGHCISCLKQLAERFREEHQDDGDEFDRRFKQALAE